MMTEDDVKKQIKTQAVLDAFELAKIQNMPANIRDRYKADELKYGRFSIHIREIIEAEKKELTIKNRKIEAEKKKIEAEKKKIEAEKKEHELHFIRYLKEKGEPLSEIQKATGLSLAEIKAIYNT